MANEYRYFLESNFVGVNRLFVLVYLNRNNDVKNVKLEDTTYQKKLLIIIIPSSIESFYDQEVDSDIRSYEEIRKLTTGQGEDYTTGCFLDYDYIKNHYRLKAVDLSRQKELNADQKAI